jgi:hypothetical protein
MPLLSEYRTECRRLLHDANANFWTDAELNTYINDGRKKVAADTKCLRALVTVNLTQNQESYPITTTLSTYGSRAIDVINVTVIWGQSRIPLLQMAWTEFNAKMRVWVTNQSRPAAMTRFGTSPGTVYIQPVPDQTYSSEWDISYIPVDLVDDTTVDELTYPFTSCVAYYAVFRAKEKEQSHGEAEGYLEKYREKAREAINQVYTRLMPNPYN